MQDHCWSYILRNWHLLQRTPTFKTTLPADTRQRLSDEVKDSLVNITSLESPGANAQSTGFSVLWDASNTQDDTAGANALGPDGKRPVSKATEKRRQRMLEQQQQQQQQQQRARSAKLKQSRGTLTSSGKANAVAGSDTAQCSTATPSADPYRQPVGLPTGRQLPNSDTESLLPGQANAAPARHPANATQQSGSTASSAAQPARSSTSRDLAGHPGLDTGAQSANGAQRNVSRRQSAPDVAAARPRLQREPNQTRHDRPSSSLAKAALPRRGATADSALGSSSASLHKTQSTNGREASADMRLGNSRPGRERQETASSQTVQEGSAQDSVQRLSQLQQMRRLSLESKPRFR